MFGALARKIFGSSNDRILRVFDEDVRAVNGLEPTYQKMSDQELANQTQVFREMISNGKSLESLIPQAFSVVREAAVRTLKMRHFDTQILGGLVLHQGKIAEMKTGEGKTLVATLPVYLNALAGKGVHVVTVNDYLAKRDSEWMSPLYSFLGLTCGYIVSGMDEKDRKAAYQADVTYGTNNEFGFDYLRDNMKFRLEDRVQRSFAYAIVDEVDSILIDEARTPLIISGPSETSTDLYEKISKLTPLLKEGDFEKDEKSKTINLTDEGVEHVEKLLSDAGLMQEGSLFDIANVDVLHHINASLRAYHLFEKDKDYIVKNHQIIIIDEFTGRMMEGRRYADGLHQSIEAKEGVPIQLENQTLASITFQNYFRMYDKLAGMTGTAMTEAAELEEIYSLEVVALPTNKPCVRVDEDDAIYRSENEKQAAIVETIKECYKKKQPVLVGTISIERSEVLSRILKKHKIPHQVLNARYHEKEAQIIAQAGKPGAITIATNMAGRGTDIQLGGNLDLMISEGIAKLKDEKKKSDKEEQIKANFQKDKDIVLKAGGLFILGTERHESRRIDNQLRGRSGRQGDPGHSKFFISLEDDLMRIFGSERMSMILGRLGLEEGEAIHHPWINKAIEKAQQKVEGRNFDIRKQLLKFDDVMNDQRKVIFDQRYEILNAEQVVDIVDDMKEIVVDDLVGLYIPEKAYHDQWNIQTLTDESHRLFSLQLPIQEWAEEEGIADIEIKERIKQSIHQLLSEKEKKYGQEVMRTAEKQILLHILDQLWKDHLLSLDHLRQGIHLRAHAQRDPLNEYKREAFELFADMLKNLRETYIMLLCRLELQTNPREAFRRQKNMPVQESHESDKGFQKIASVPPASRKKVDPNNVPAGWVYHEELAYHIDPTDPETWGRVPRNIVCPCGSGKKYKFCHGKI